MADEVLVPPPVVGIVLRHLAEQLPRYGFRMPVGHRVQTGTTESVRVLAAGGVKRDEVTWTRGVIVEARAALAGRAEDILNAAVGLVLDLEDTTPEGHRVYVVRETSGPVDLPDLTSTERMTQTLELDVRGRYLTVADPDQL